MGVRSRRNVASCTSRSLVRRLNSISHVPMSAIHSGTIRPIRRVASSRRSQKSTSISRAIVAQHRVYSVAEPVDSLASETSLRKEVDFAKRKTEDWDFRKANPQSADADSSFLKELEKTPHRVSPSETESSIHNTVSEPS